LATPAVSVKNLPIHPNSFWRRSSVLSVSHRPMQWLPFWHLLPLVWHSPLPIPLLKTSRAMRVTNLSP